MTSTSNWEEMIAKKFETAYRSRAVNLLIRAMLRLGSMPGSVYPLSVIWQKALLHLY